MLSPRGTFIHIGANRSHGTLGPFFPDGSFRYLPIPEDCPSKDSWTYAELRLAEYAPTGRRYAHYDPEFETFTWGDYVNKRTFYVRQLREGDYVFFIESLQAYEDYAKRILGCAWAYCIVGYFVMLEPIPYLRDVGYPIASGIKQSFGNNAHVRRSETSSYPKCLEPFCIYRGSRLSRPSPKAIPISKKQMPNELAYKVVTNLNPNRPRWWECLINQDSVTNLLEEIAEHKQ